MSSSTPAGFEPFPRLPLELRREIWGFASAIPRPRPGFCVLPPNPRDPDCPWVVVEHGNIALLLTCWEARRTALDSLVTRPYDPATDILFIPLSEVVMFFSNLCGNGAPVWLYSVHHIATPFPPAWVCTYMTWALKVGSLRSVESVSIVFPNTPERLDSLGGGSPPPWRWAGLRAVADAEMDEFYASPDGDGVRGGVRDDYDFGYIPAVFGRFMTDCGLQTVEDYEMQKKSSIRDQLATIVLALKKDAAAREERGRPEVKTIAKRFDLLWGDTGVGATVAVGSR